jgi:hypothetical protein
MEVEKLKLLKGRFDPKTLVTGKKGRGLPNQTSEAHASAIA